MTTSRMPLLWATAALSALCWAAMPAAACGGGDPCPPGWSATPQMARPTITAPTSLNNACGINAEVPFACTVVTDWDTYTDAYCTKHPVDDTVTYTWSATGGSFPLGNTGRNVTWRAPATPGTCTVTVTVNDAGEPGRDDAPVSASRVMHVIRLDKVRLYFHYPGTGYPYAGDAQIDTRAVVTATTNSQHDYCGMPFNTSLQWWWKAGTEGPQGDDVPPPVTPMYTGQPLAWPSNWPPMTFDWKLLWQGGAKANCTGSDRKYGYTQVDYLGNSWGEENRVYNTQGVHRLRATARMHPGTSWEQAATSLNKEYALRICPKSHCDWIDHPMRRAFVEWTATYVNVPYEWGGEGFGGKDSSDQCAGAAGSYEGYGMDCSGLISCGAYRAGYNWSTWRQGTWGLIGSYCSEPVSREDFSHGDILVKGGLHVVACVRRYDPPREDAIRITHAYGVVHKVLEEESTIEHWTDQGYSLRRLRAY